MPRALRERVQNFVEVVGDMSLVRSFGHDDQVAQGGVPLNDRPSLPLRDTQDGQAVDEICGGSNLF
jgi:hypothetical protein